MTEGKGFKDWGKRLQERKIEVRSKSWGIYRMETGRSFDALRSLRMIILAG